MPVLLDLYQFTDFLTYVSEVRELECLFLMPSTLQIDISESAATLKMLLHQQSSACHKERLQALYWLKSGQVTTRLELSSLLGRGESTLYRWLKLYKTGGLCALLDIKSSSGRPAMIRGEALDKLKAHLSEPQGFESYGAIQQWLRDECDLEVPYKTVHQTVHYRLKAKLKVPRPRSRQADEAQQQAYKKTASPDYGDDHPFWAGEKSSLLVHR